VGQCNFDGTKNASCREDRIIAGEPLDLIRPSQSPHDSILWILSDHNGQMTIGELRRRMGLRLHELTPILEDLEREGKIGINGKIVFIL
jgi:hypothetical protein